jgi:hypothetical protein
VEADGHVGRKVYAIFDRQGSTLRHRSVALVTRDPALYGELAGLLRERRWPAVSLLPGQRIPESVAVVLTSASEAELIHHERVLTVAPDGDHRALRAAVEHALGPGNPEGEIIVGIDPGPEPGYAVWVGSSCIGEGILESPESVALFASQIHHRFPSRHVLFRVGAGDPPDRNRIVNKLLAHHRSIEVVNEHRTTPRGHRRPRDAAAARSIAQIPGDAIRERIPLTFTPGEIANLQRLSRMHSGGRFTISRSSAVRVLRGEVSLSEAVDAAAHPGLAASVGTRSAPELL